MRAELATLRWNKNINMYISLVNERLFALAKIVEIETYYDV